jgi:D-tyrosyl-tRNA(Tyr) deacylase
MVAVIQRVTRASVAVDGEIVGAVECGFLVLVGAKKGDSTDDADMLSDKICAMRIFADERGRMNLSLSEVGGGILAVPNFTLLANMSHGRRPNFMNAESPKFAEGLFSHFVRRCKINGIKTETGVFGAHMAVELENDGPVTIIIDTDTLKGKSQNAES